MIRLANVSFEIAGKVIFEELNLTLSQGRYGLVGPNGVGKSTLARLITGRVNPTAGSVDRRGHIACFEQSEPISDIRLSDYLADIWTADSHYPALIASLTGTLDMDRRLTELSGGEWIRARLARILATKPDFLILDEPSNNLDHDGRNTLAGFMHAFDGGMLLISHDRSLLNLVDTILELSNQGLTSYGGNFDFYWHERNLERQRLADRLDEAKRQGRKQHLDDLRKLEQQEKRMREGARRAVTEGMSRIESSAKKRMAQGSMGNLKRQTRVSSENISDRIAAAAGSVKMDPFVRLDFEGMSVPAGKTVVHAEALNWRFPEARHYLWRVPIDLFVTGPQRWVLAGSNGAGKSTLLRIMAGQVMPGNVRLQGTASGRVRVGTSNVAYLDQNYALLERNKSILANILPSSRFSEGELRNELAFFGFTGDAVFQPAGTLSGGEMLKASLAQAFLGPRIPELMILDEPTNNLDLSSLETLENAVRGFRGAVLVASHDSSFLDRIAVTHWLTLPEKS